MKKLRPCLYIAAFLLLLLVPLLLTNTEKDVVSDLDNRTLASFPVVGDSKFAEKTETYLQDRIGLRDEMVTGYQLLNNAVAGELEHPLYTYGRDGYVFLDIKKNVTYGDYHQTFAKAVQKMQKYCESRGIRFYFMFDPAKTSVYRQYLPEGVNYGNKWVDKLLSNLEKLGVNCVSNLDLLVKRSKTEQVFNRQYDAGHWNDLGCFYATNNLWKRIHKDFPAVTEYEKDEFEIRTVNGRYLASSKFEVNEQVPVFTLKAENGVRTGLYADLKLDKNHRFFQDYVNFARGAEEYPKMLVFHGSYYNRNPKFFLGRASEYVGVHDYQNVLNLDYYVNIFQPDLVVFEVAEYTVSNQYFDRETMENLRFNPGLVGDGQTAEEAAAAAKEQAKASALDSGAAFHVVSHDGFDVVYLDRDISFARYAYLFVGGRIFDLKEDEYGTWSAGVPRNACGEKATLYWVDYAGGRYYADLDVEQAKCLFLEEEEITLTSGASANGGNSWRFRTNGEGNAFNRVQLQVSGAVDGKLAATPETLKKTGSANGVYRHTKKSGWYTVMLKANGQQKDEGIETLAYLVKGGNYYYSFELTTFNRKNAIVRNFSFFGPGGGTRDRQELALGLVFSDGTAEAGEGAYLMKTEEEGNAFNKVILQLYRKKTGVPLSPIFEARRPGRYTGRYEHTAAGGTYLLRLRANSNRKDEYVLAEAKLKKGALYEWSYELESLDETEAAVKDFSFVRVGNPPE